MRSNNSACADCAMRSFSCNSISLLYCDGQYRQCPSVPSRGRALSRALKGSGRLLPASALTAFDLAKGLKDIDDTARRNTAVIELQEKLLIAQSAQAELLERIRTLEEKVANFETWDTEKQRYELKPFGNAFAYVLKPRLKEENRSIRYVQIAMRAARSRFSHRCQLTKQEGRLEWALFIVVLNARPKFDCTSASDARIRDTRGAAHWFFNRLGCQSGPISFLAQLTVVRPSADGGHDRHSNGDHNDSKSYRPNLLAASKHQDA